jgi:hypothetical protein
MTLSEGNPLGVFSCPSPEEGARAFLGVKTGVTCSATSTGILRHGRSPTSYEAYPMICSFTVHLTYDILPSPIAWQSINWWTFFIIMASVSED